MKHIILSFLFFVASSAAIAQNREIRDLSSFGKISVGQSIKLTLEKGSENKVRIETSGVEADRVITEVSGSNLDIRMKKGNYRSTTVEVYLIFKGELEGIKAGSSASVQSKSKIISKELTIKVSSSAKLELDTKTDELEIRVSSSGRANLTVDTENLNIGVSSSGKLEVAGTTNFQSFDVSSSGRFMAYDLSSEKAKANISSSGSAEITVAKELIANASSSGRISYKGNPDKVLTDSSSSGRVRKAN
ncbi:MAG: hypothetical protein ACJA2S_000536 [Cyclobacteriaceae bacterium]|jgi:hypothetical protein